MKKTKFAYLFATTLVAGTMGLTSCQEEVENPVAKEGSVTIGLSTVATRATANDVNMGSTLQQIDNVVVVPMIGNAYQNPILFGNFDPKDTKVTKQTRTMSEAVTRFKVFGNVCEGYVTPATLSETTVFTGLTFTAPTWTEGAPAGGATYSKPHELYYYYDTNGVGFSASEDVWDTTEPSNWITGVQLLGSYKSVKITPVNYAVGVLAAAIQNGDVTTAFYKDAACEGVSNTFDGSQITVSGITIAGQTQSFDADFTPSGTVNVYETAAAGTIATDDSKKVSNSARGNGNIYCVVAPTTAETETVTLNIEFTVASGVYFKLADGKTIVGNGQKLYLPVVLNKELASKPAAEGATEIFQADRATFLNAKVMQWGLASETPVETTDVTIGVEFDVTWGEGLSFDVEI